MALTFKHQPSRRERKENCSDKEQETGGELKSERNPPGCVTLASAGTVWVALERSATNVCDLSALESV